MSIAQSMEKAAKNIKELQKTSPTGEPSFTEKQPVNKVQGCIQADLLPLWMGRTCSNQVSFQGYYGSGHKKLPVALPLNTRCTPHHSK